MISGSTPASFVPKAPRELALSRLLNLVGPLASAAAAEQLHTKMPAEMAHNHPSFKSTSNRLEGVARYLLGISPLLEIDSLAENPQELTCACVAARLALQNIVSPSSRDFVPFDQGTQPLVEASFIALSLLRAPKGLWETLDKITRDNLINALRSTRKIRPHHNNWLLFSAVIEAFFYKVGLEWDPMRVDYALRQHEQWYAGDGWHGDGPNFHLDYYNSFVIHPLLLELYWAVAGQHSDWDKMYPQALARAQRHAVQLERLIGPDGSYPIMGRSITYRCGAFHLLALLAWKRLLPPQLAPAQVRGALIATIERSLGNSQNYDENGWLRIGLNGWQPSLAESYISTGSLYLCCTAFLPLGLPPTDPFWSAPDEPWTQRRLWWLQDEVPIDRAIRN